MKNWRSLRNRCVGERHESKSGRETRVYILLALLWLKLHAVGARWLGFLKITHLSTPPSGRPAWGPQRVRLTVEGLEQRQMLSAMPVLTITDAGGAFTGSSYPGTALVGANSGSMGSSLEGVTPTLSYYSGGTLLNGGAPTQAGNYSVQAFFGGSSDYSSCSASAAFTVTKATPALSVSDAGGPYSGTSYPATAQVGGNSNSLGNSLEGVTPTLTYYSGGTQLAGAPTQTGSYSAVANFGGSNDFTTVGASVAFTINPTISLTATQTTQKNVTLSGQVKDANPGGLTINFTGQYTGSVVTNANGTFSVNVVARGLGTIQASVTDGVGLTSNVATATLTSQAPTIVNFQAARETGNTYTFSGTVQDPSAAGLQVALSGFNDLNGITATVAANGTFSVTVTLSEGDAGNVQAEVTNWWGLQAQPAQTYVDASY